MLQEADMGTTNMAMGGSNARYLDDDRLLVRFFTHPKLNSTKTKEEGRPIYQEVPYIQIMSPGNKDSIVVRPATDMDIQRFPEHFRKYEAREDQEALEGTPLVEWTGVTRSQAEELKFFNILTVEQLATLADVHAQNIMGIGLLKQKAVAWLEAAKEEATAEALLDANNRIEELQRQVEMLLKANPAPEVEEELVD